MGAIEDPVTTPKFDASSSGSVTPPTATEALDLLTPASPTLRPETTLNTGGEEDAASADYSCIQLTLLCLRPQLKSRMRKRRRA